MLCGASQSPDGRRLRRVQPSTANFGRPLRASPPPPQAGSGGGGMGLASLNWSRLHPTIPVPEKSRPSRPKCPEIVCVRLSTTLSLHTLTPSPFLPFLLRPPLPSIQLASPVVNTYILLFPPPPNQQPTRFLLVPGNTACYKGITRFVLVLLHPRQQNVR